MKRRPPPSPDTAQLAVNAARAMAVDVRTIVDRGGKLGQHELVVMLRALADAVMLQATATEALIAEVRR